MNAKYVKSIVTSAVALIFLWQSGMAQIKVKPLAIKERTLANGLKVVSVRDNSSPTVAIHVWYNVGGKNDPQGKSGFAHMFEHMMFKSTKNMANEQMDRLTEDVGGYNNASTWDDFTNYYEVVPSNYLKTLLWAEAERMANLNVDDTNFASERDVVKEEFRQSVLAQPYGRLFEYLGSLSYTTHPYKRGVIGDLDQLNAATSADARAFHSLYYRPDNAYLIVVGDFDQKQFDGWVDEYFGKLAKPSTAIPRVTVKEPARTKELRFEKSAPNVPFPAVAITYLGPRSDDADIPALKVAENILAAGESSRLYQSLVYKEQIAQEAEFSIDNKVDGGLLYFLAIASEGHTPKELEAALLSQLKLIQEKGITAKELQKAKNQLIASAVKDLETNDGKAIAIERAVAYQHDPSAVNRSVAKLQAVTAADVQRVMKKYFNDNNRVVIYYTDQGGEK
ncbi:MAG: insulinase family protein [Chloracidobacterium sp.]|nr:insulinase family protein [Chloracidobacterium sp.]MCO5332640.1 insulinase family protein [Pyrinomonadaceae bacterium]